MNNKSLKIVALCLIAICNVLVSKAQAPYGNAGDHTPVEFGSPGTPFGYYEYLPTDFNNTSGDEYPLVLFYHGFGERGNGTSQLSRVLQHGPPKLIQQGEDFEAIIISPQNSDANYFAPDFLSLYNYLIANYPIDISRVYVTGLSSGGGSTWMALNAHYDKIAAAVPVCGSRYLSNPAEFLQETPIWTFHAFNDNVVNTSISISNSNRIANNGNSVMSVYPYGSGNSAASEDYTMHFDTATQTWSSTSGSNEPLDKNSFTLYKNGGHDSWTATYDNSEVWDWLFAQSLNTLSIDEETIDFKLYPNPTSDNITISTTNNTEKTIDIYDIFGTKVYENLFSNELTIDMSTYSSGIYFAKILGDNNIEEVLKIVVK